jgi:NAD(P)H dehydrogenase (quinone)
VSSENRLFAKRTLLRYDSGNWTGRQGMVIAGVPYSVPGLSNLSEISGGTPYGASTIAGTKGDRRPTENELAVARAQGRHVAQIASKLNAK